MKLQIGRVQFRTIFAALITLGLAVPATAQTQVGGVLFLQSDLTKDGSFDVTRGYINVTSHRDKLSVRFTPDITRSATGSLSVRVKYAYAQFDPTSNSSVRFGASQTPWIDFEEHINRYRVQGTLTAERNGILPSSSDIGITYSTSISRFDVQGGVYNGEGVYGGDGNIRKSAQGRLTFDTKLQGVKVSGFATSDEVYIASVHRATPRTVVLVEQISKGDVSTQSVFGELRQGGKGLAAFGRADLGDSDRYIVGGAYWVDPKFGVIVSNDRTGGINRTLAQVQAEF